MCQTLCKRFNLETLRSIDRIMLNEANRKRTFFKESLIVYIVKSNDAP